MRGRPQSTAPGGNARRPLMLLRRTRQVKNRGRGRSCAKGANRWIIRARRDPLNRRPGISVVVLALVLGGSVSLPGAPRDTKRTGPGSPETSTLVERATVEKV